VVSLYRVIENGLGELFLQEKIGPGWMAITKFDNREEAVTRVQVLRNQAENYRLRHTVKEVLFEGDI
jgi:hypothetical protein